MLAPLLYTNIVLKFFAVLQRKHCEFNCCALKGYILGDNFIDNFVFDCKIDLK